jgi:hypothetical protein
MVCRTTEEQEGAPRGQYEEWLDPRNAYVYRTPDGIVIRVYGCFWTSKAFVEFKAVDGDPDKLKLIGRRRSRGPVRTIARRISSWPPGRRIERIQLVTPTRVLPLEVMLPPWDDREVVHVAHVTWVRAIKTPHGVAIAIDAFIENRDRYAYIQGYKDFPGRFTLWQVEERSLSQETSLNAKALRSLAASFRGEFGSEITLECADGILTIPIE